MLFRILAAVIVILIIIVVNNTCTIIKMRTSVRCGESPGVERSKDVFVPYSQLEQSDKNLVQNVCLDRKEPIAIPIS